ncbi:hypothetical protein K458DRAFT_431558 [Lentithecium fluviatile CBS 122367]|uniref:Transcription factor domain-containing protein n=1 Tax=Lentithecium fluviatile CBS 122367 TaxID=1168545 RepID=A0A6G1J098_9PLEO|nr:hypothetical protein K458DRAFT_431558 [Lentithecium fluviatile CBS 122367]
MAQREFEFFVTTEEPHQPEGLERGLIRRLVMRNFFEAKSAGVEKEGEREELSSEATVKAKGRLKTRFRLGVGKGKVKGKNGACKSGVKGWKVGEGPGMERKEGARTKSGLVGESGGDWKGGLGSRRVSPIRSDGGEADKGNEGKKISLTISPSAHRFDPFDVLPVPGTHQLDLLFRLHKSGSRINSLTTNARKTWWNFISNDAGLLHATLATWALYGMLARGLYELRVEKLRHKNEAIKGINTKIGDPAGTMSDELVGTVATLASFENLLGAYDSAHLHIAALKRMVNARGGLFAFGHNDGLIRGIQWVDFHTAAAFRTPPAFPLIRLDPDALPLPSGLLEAAACTSPTSLLQLSVAAIECFNVFYRLHRLALAISPQWICRVSRLTFSTLLYETEHMLLSVPDYSRDFLDFDLEAKDERGEDYEERKRLADGASVTEALLGATQVFVYAALREIPTRAKIFGILIERIRVAADRPGVDMLEVWRGVKNLNTLLWVLAVAASVEEMGKRSWWIERLSDVAGEFGIESRMEFEDVLNRVAWTGVFFGDEIEGVWAEVCRVREDSRGGGEEGMVTGMPDPLLLHGNGSSPVDFEKGGWKVGGWYV